MSNKNKAGIDNFMISEKLFPRGKLTQTRVSLGQKTSEVSSLGKSNTTKGHDYHKNDEPMNRKYETNKEDHENENEGELCKKRKNDCKDTSIAHEENLIMNYKTNKKEASFALETDRLPVSKEELAEGQWLSKSHVIRSRLAYSNANTTKRQFIKKEPDAMPEIPYEEESKASFQGIVVKSSNKYFNSCRTEATHYTLKINSILEKEIESLHNSLRQIRESVEESYNLMGEQIKEDMYKIVDGCVSEWKAFCIENFHKNEIDYMGEILEVATLYEERLKQIQSYEFELQDEKHWRNRASDLLKTDYERDLVELSKLCQKSTNSSQESVKQFLEVALRTTEKKFTYLSQTSTISNEILKFLNRQPEIGSLNTKNHIEQKQIQTPSKNEKSQLKSLHKSHIFPLTLKTEPQREKREFVYKCESCCRPYQTEDMNQNKLWLKNERGSYISEFELNEEKEDDYGEEESIKECHIFKVNEKRRKA